MSDAEPIPSTAVSPRAEALNREHLDALYRRTDRMFAWLMLGQWLFAIFVALTFSPYGWRGKIHTTHVHVLAAVFLGGVISSLPILLAWRRPGEPLTRHVIAVSQMAWSALLIHLSGGRIETHFHVFGSLAILAFYRDWRVLATGTVTVATDHFIRGLVWPESVYGIVNPEWWRFLEHAFWVAFQVSFLTLACFRGLAELRAICERQAETELLSALEKKKSAALDEALHKIASSQDMLVRTERLAAVGQLSASVGHELRNPLAAIQNAATYIEKRLRTTNQNGDPRIPQFLEIIDRELGSCKRIISDLLDFARERPTSPRPCPIKPLVDEAITLVAPRPNVSVSNQVANELPVPNVDKEQFRQVLINLIQNAVESIPPEQEGRVVVRAEGGGTAGWRICVADNGIGMPTEVASKIFEPLFTTKAKGTGLGLAIVQTIVTRHGGTIRVESRAGHGTEFSVELPAASAEVQRPGVQV